MSDYGLSTTDLVIGTSGGVSVAPVGTTLPTTWDASLDGAFVPLGYLTPAGPSIPSQPTVQDINAWQSSTPIASRVTERPMTVEFELMQWNADTIAFAYGGGSISTAGTGYVYEPPEGEEADEYAMVLDVLDGDNVVRYVFERGYPASGTSPSFNRDGAAVLSVGYKVLTPADGDVPFRIYSNIADWAPGS